MGKKTDGAADLSGAAIVPGAIPPELASDSERGPKRWSGRADLNCRPPGPKPGALPLGHAPDNTREESWRGRVAVVPPERIELSSPAPEAGTLSAELQGHSAKRISRPRAAQQLFRNLSGSSSLHGLRAGQPPDATARGLCLSELTLPGCYRTYILIHYRYLAVAK